MNQLRKAVRDYLTMRRGLGFKLAKHEGGLQEFVSFLAQKRRSRITVNLALEWATLNPHHKPYDWAARPRSFRGLPVLVHVVSQRARVLRLLCAGIREGSPFSHSRNFMSCLRLRGVNRPTGHFEHAAAF